MRLFKPNIKRMVNRQEASKLISALYDLDERVRAAAEAGLLKLQHERATDAFVHALGNPDAQVRLYAAQALGQIKDSHAVYSLVLALQDSNMSVRSQAAQSLGQIQDSRAVEWIILALVDSDRSDWFAEARLACVALGALAVQPLIGVLLSPEFYLKQTIDNLSRRSSLRRLASTLLIEIGSQAEEPMVFLLTNSSEQVSRCAIDILEKIGGPACLPHLERIANSTSPMSNLVLPELAMQAIASICRRHKCAESFLSLVIHTRRRYAWNILEEEVAWMVNPATVKFLITKLLDINKPVRENATEALKIIHHSTSVDALIISLLHDRDESLRRGAAYALGAISNPMSVNNLITVLDDPLVSDAAEKALVGLGIHAVDLLIALLRQEDGSMRAKIAAVRILGRIGDLRACEPLKGALHSANASLRNEAVYALESLGEPQLILALDHPEIKNTSQVSSLAA